MAYNPADPFPKSRGDAIRSQDWNDAVLELQRLDTAKINKAGDAITGSLNVSGNLGVGTTSPGAKLHVAGGGSIRWGNNSELVADQGGSIELGGNNTTAGTGLPYIDFHFSGLTQDFNTRITNDANGQLSLIASTLRATGNVGIGTASPQRALSVNTALNVDQANANGGAVNPGITFGSSSGEGIASKRTTGGNQAGLDLYTNNAARLSITNGGNVGIGGMPPANQRLLVQITGGGTDEVRGVQAQASGVGTGPKYGLYGSATGAGEKLAGYFEADSAGNEPTRGGFGRATGTGTGPKYAIHGVAGGGGEKYGGFFEAQGGDASWTNAVQGNAYGAGTGPKYGLYGSATGAGEKHAGYFYANSAGNELTMGTQSSASGAGTGPKYGTQATATGGGEKYAGWFEASSAGADWTQGVFSQAYGDGTGLKVGIRSTVSGGGEKRAGWFEANTISTDGSWTYGNLVSASTAGAGGVFGTYSYAYSAGTGTKYGIYSYAAGGGTSYAGFFAGNVYVSGTLSAGSKPFVIDHPLDPENKTLRHNAVESPETLCLYRGKVKIDPSGSKMVRMPDYFAALTKEEEATVYLTSVGKESSPASYQWDETHTTLTVFGSPDSEVAYLVLADRDDPTVHMLARPVEEEKGDGNFEKGQFLNPEAFEQPAEMGVAALLPQEDAGQPEVAVPEPVPAEPAAPEPAREEPPQPEPVQPTRPGPVAPEAPAGAEGADEQGDRESSDVDATEAAERRARELGVRLSEVKGTGSGGRILVNDVERAAKA